MNTLITILALTATIGGTRPGGPDSGPAEDTQDANAFFGGRPSCAAGLHDDGAGECVKRGCATGYHDGGAGKCVALDVCSPRFHDDGAGKCVAKGCAAGFVVGKEGACVGPAGLVWAERFNARRWAAVTASASGSKLLGAVENGALFTSDDGGVGWTHRNPKDVWNGIASSSDGATLLAVGTGVYLSVDAGASWKRIDPLPSSNPDEPWKKPETHIWSAGSVSADGKRLIVALRDGALYGSSDSGAHWTEMATPQPWVAVTSSADGSKLAAAAKDGAIFLSSDGGAHWAASSAAPQRWVAVVSSADGGRLAALAVDQEGRGGQLLVSADAGKTWKSRKLARAWRCIAASADGNRLIAGEDGGRLQLSVDGGRTWTERGEAQNWRGVSSSADGSFLVGVTYGPESGAGTVFTSTGPLR